MAEIVLINPRFEVSFWGLEHAMPLFGKKANLPVACLPLLAALTPPPHRVLLAKQLAKLVHHGIAVLGAPAAIGGVLIALIVFTPEGMSALRAALANHLQRSVNLCLGGALSTIGLTVPAVLGIGLLTGQPVVLGLNSAEMVLLAITLTVSTLTFSVSRTTVLEGAVHLVLFFVYIVLIFSP
jgi:Ca2+:H+ antiporter